MQLASKEQIHDFLARNIAKLLNQPELQEQIESDRSLPEAGLDSLLLINLIVQIEMNYDIAFDDDEMLLSNFGSVRTIANMIARKLEAIA